jgi:DNA-directed RNA polymerase subunit RPC12/RpoP
MSKYKITWASSTVYRCERCKTWYTRFPDFMGEPFDKGDECERCGNTSFISSKGRPFGIKSEGLKYIQEQWDDDEDFWVDWIIDNKLESTIKTEPQLEPTEQE